MFDEINDLPADDPLRARADVGTASTGSTSAIPPDLTAAHLASAHVASGPVAASRILTFLPAKVVAAFEANGRISSAIPDTEPHGTVPRFVPVAASKTLSRANGAVVVDAGRRVAVPSFDGVGVRKVVETAAALGLRVEPVGSGIAREQAPAAGTRVPVGTQVVVRFMR